MDIVSKLDKRITFKDIVQTPDNAGGFIESLTDVKTVWARVKPMNVAKLFTEGILLQEKVYEIHVRKDAITPTQKMVIDYNGLELAIKGAVDIEEAGYYWRILASTVTNG